MKTPIIERSIQKVQITTANTNQLITFCKYRNRDVRDVSIRKRIIVVTKVISSPHYKKGVWPQILILMFRRFLNKEARAFNDGEERTLAAVRSGVAGDSLW